MPRKQESERNYQIFLEVESAKMRRPSYEEIAKKFGITKQRVGQIYNKEKERIEKLSNKNC